MPNRPRIPSATELQVLVECGHRCAACGESCPLERAHIIPWSKSKDHSPENLICLCANCHQRADNEKWGSEALRNYKLKPWVNRRFAETQDRLTQMSNLEVTIQMEVRGFTKANEEWLKSALSAVGEISPNSIKIVMIEKGSVRIILELPKVAADRILADFGEESSLLSKLLAPIIIQGIREVTIYVGTVVGESTSQEFRLAVAHEMIKEQDIIAIDGNLGRPNLSGEVEQIRIWAKVQKIERLNPLFPSEAGHELAETRTDPFDTVLSMSREMVTAVCQILGYEPIDGSDKGKLNQLRYPPRPASSAYRPVSSDIARIVLGELQQRRALDIATLSNRPEVDVLVDGHAIVTRHLAILAMTGSGKSVTARRIVEELSKKNYPIVIFDPHGDYTGLADIEGIGSKVKRYHAQFPVFEQSADTVIKVIESLGWALANTHRSLFEELFRGAHAFLSTSNEQLKKRAEWLSEYLHNENINKFGVKPNLFFLADFVQAVVIAGKEQDDDAFQQMIEWTKREQLKVNKQTAGWLEGLPNNLRTAAKRLKQMEDISRKVAKESEPLPTDRVSLVRYDGISIVALAGYTGDFQATIYSLIAEEIFSARVSNELKLPVLLLLEEAHNFAPARATTPSEERSISITKQIAQEGRKFGVGLILISQRPSRLDETTLSQANSYIIMRMANPADQNYVRRVVESLGEEDAKMLPDLDVGEAILSGQLINFPVLVRIKKPQSEGEREEKDAFEALEEAQKNIQANARN